MRSRLFYGASAVAVALTLGAWGQGALAQETEVREVEVVASTGSFIARETTALPVDVVSTQDLEAQGAPTTVDLVKTITASASGLGESNRYNGGAGTASINLRGFGASRTLSLMNGRRLPDTTAAAFQGGGANLNAIPSAAVGRIEILKDGAAATYGSEAIGGVVNFITRTDLDGFEVQGQYRFISDSDGDYEGSIAWGNRFDRGNVLLTAGYRHRSRVDIRDRDFALLPFYASAAGGFSSNGNPGNYHTNSTNALQSTANYLFRDNGCAELGGTLTIARTVPNLTLGGTSTIAIPVNPNNPATSTVATTCQFQFSTYNDIVNEEDHYQFYAELNYDLTDNVRMHAEAFYSIDDVPNQRISPANGNTQFPTPEGTNCMNAACTVLAPGGGLSGSNARTNPPNFFVPYNVPWHNPGLQDLRTQCLATPAGVGIITAAQCTSIVGASAANAAGVDVSQTAFRFISNAGSPRGTDGADRQTVHIETYRVSAGLAGEFNDSLRWDTNVLYAESSGEVETADLLVNRVQAALNGWGSRLDAADQCTVAERTAANRGNAAVGCYYFNPMSSAIPVSATNGQVNPFYRGNVNAAVNNNEDVILWLYGPYTSTTTNQLFVADAVISGDTPLSLWGGQIQFALGTQYRWNRDLFDVEGFQDTDTFPCVDSIDDGLPACGAPNGPTIFFGGQSDSDTDRTVWAAFGELRLPVTDTFEVSLAGRFESFSNGIGETFNPKVSVRWQLNDAIAIRGSAGTTFRAPTAAQVNPNCGTGVANLAGQYRAVQTCGNPGLEPETADAYNIGLIVQHSGLNVTLDYWIINFEGELTTEGAANLVAAMWPSLAAGVTTHTCGTVPALEARFTFTTGTCANNASVLSTDILRVDTFAVNGPDTTAQGVDFRASYDWSWNEGWYEGNFQVGVEATYLHEYARGAFQLFTDPSVVFAQPFDRAGTYDFISAFFSYPRLKSNLWLSYNRGPLNVRWQVQYTSGVEPAVNTISTIAVADGNPNTFGYHAERLFRSDDFWQHNLIVRWEFTDQITATLNVANIFDEDPPFVVSNFNYDYTNGNPLGRTFEIGLRARF